MFCNFKKSRSRIWLIFLTFIYFTPIKTIYIDSNYILLFLCIFSLIFNKEVRRLYLKLAPLLMRSIIIVFVLMIVAIVSLIINDTYDLFFPSMLAKFVISLTIGLWISVQYALSTDKNSFILNASIAGFLLAITVILEIFSPGFKTLLNSILAQVDSSDYTTDFRYRGIATAGGASLSLYLAFTVYCTLLLKRVHPLFSTMALWLITIAVMFIGRTGFIFSAISIIIYYFHGLFFGESKAKVVLEVLIIILLAIFMYSFFENYMSRDQVWLLENWTFEIFNGFLNSGRLESTATTALNNMYFTPAVRHLIFGAGYFSGNYFNYPWTDGGYMRSILAVGIMGAIIIYITFLLSVLMALYYATSIGDYKYRSLIIITSVTLLISEYKEEFIYQNFSSRFFIILIFLIYACKKLRGNKSVNLVKFSI